MAKKKKPAANPARGVATVSLPRKTKDAEVATSSPLPTAETENGSIALPSVAASTPATIKPDHEREFHELSPEELDARLEESELQGLVDKFAARSQRDASRQVGKLQAECRILRAQAQPLTTKPLLSDLAIKQILDLAAKDVEERTVRVDELSPRKALQEEEAIGRLWTLQRTLLALGFHQEQIHAALRYVLKLSVINEDSGSIWGLEEVMEWLVVKYAAEELPSYDTATGKLYVEKIETDEVLPDALNLENTPNEGSRNINGSKLSFKKTAKSESAPELGSTSSQLDIEISDIESDLEPDELLARYLATKQKLFEIQPELFGKNGRNSLKKQKAESGMTAGPQSSSHPAVTKLQRKLQKIESDLLFDDQDADSQWQRKLIELARETADRRQLQLPPPAVPAKVSRPPPRILSASPTIADTSESSSDESESESDNALGNLFASSSECPPTNLSPNPGTNSSDAENVIIRDFGTSKGISARRILDEACRARDSGAKLVYRSISRSAFAIRHQLIIHWSKDQDMEVFLDLQDTDCYRRPRQSVFIMKTISTPDTAQSEAYVSTVALFQIFSTSAKEDKVYLRLSPAWRDLWFDLSEQRKVQAEVADRTNVRILRDIVRNQMTEDDEEDVVLTRNFIKRTNGEEAETSVTAQEKSELIGEEKQVQMRTIWSAKVATPSYQRMLGPRSLLPISHFRNDALAAIENNQVTIICGETGCGKSTQLPAYVLERQLSQGRPCKIYCTEPRRISAITLAQRVSEELGEHKNDLGTARSLVGYAIRLESHVSSTTRLVYATTGIVLRMLESKNGFDEVTHVIIDEVHERSIETDFLLIILRSLIQKRPNLKVILMSATVNAELFSNYFKRAPVLNVPGRTFPVTTRFLEDAIELTGYDLNKDGRVEYNAGDEDEDVDSPSGASGKTDASALAGYNAKTRAVLSNYDEYRVDFGLVASLIEKITSDPAHAPFAKAILVFLPGLAEIRRLNDMLSGTPLSHRYVIHLLHSSIASEDQQRAFAIPPRGLGKIVLSTNIAETGVTIPDITMVIDTGKHKEMRFDERRQISRLVESFISRANAKQRRGRAGRVQEGMCFHLFTKQRHDTLMAEQQTPEMLRLSLQDLIMRVKICKLGDIQTTLANALDPPSAKNIRRAIDALIEVDALTASEQLTPLGLQLSKLPLDPYLGKLVLFGSVFGCLDLALTTAAILTSKSPFVSSVGGTRKQADLARLSFRHGDSDLLTDFAAYAAWRRVCTTNATPEHQFCAKASLSALTLANIEDLKAQLLGVLADGGVVALTASERAALSGVQNSSSPRGPRRFAPVPAAHDRHAGNEGLVYAVAAAAFHPKLLVRDGKGWRAAASGAAVALHPTSVARLGGGAGVAPHVRYMTYYSIVQAGAGARHLNATALTPTAALPMLLMAGEVAWHPVALVGGLDVGSGGRLRFGVEGWKAMAALKWLRACVDGIAARAWLAKGTKDIEGRGVGRGSDAEWTALWEGIVKSWVPDS